MPKYSKIDKDCYVFLLAKAYQKGHKLVQNRLQPYGLTNIQYVVLEVLWQRKGIRAAEIGRLLSIDKATLSGILDRMTEAGWIIKQQDEKDRRMFGLFPSKKANDLKVKLVQERKAANEELLSKFTMEEKIVLKRLLLELT